MTRPSPYPDDTYAPMQKRPARLECGKPAHKVATDPPCCLVGWILHESSMEIATDLHDDAVPPFTQPIPKTAGDLDGPQVMVTDSGPLGGKPWSRFMNRSMNIRMRDDELVQHLHPDRVFGVKLAEWRRYCAGHHSFWSEHRGQPMCWMLIDYIVKARGTVSEAASAHGVTRERAAWLLHRSEDREGRVAWQGAIDKLWTWIANDLNGIYAVRVKRGDEAA